MSDHLVRLYLGGPISGYPDMNYPAFKEGALLLRLKGYEVLNPVELNEAEGIRSERDIAGWTKDQLAALLLRDLEAILDTGCRGMATLPGWETSVGSHVEVAFMRFRGLPVHPIAFYLEDGQKGEPQ